MLRAKVHFMDKVNNARVLYCHFVQHQSSYLSFGISGYNTPEDSLSYTS